MRGFQRRVWSVTGESVPCCCRCPCRSFRFSSLSVYSVVSSVLSACVRVHLDGSVSGRSFFRQLHLWLLSRGEVQEILPEGAAAASDDGRDLGVASRAVSLIRPADPLESLSAVSAAFTPPVRRLRCLHTTCPPSPLPSHRTGS